MCINIYMYINALPVYSLKDKTLRLSISDAFPLILLEIISTVFNVFNIIELLDHDYGRAAYRHESPLLIYDCCSCLCLWLSAGFLKCDRRADGVKRGQGNKVGWNEGEAVDCKLGLWWLRCIFRQQLNRQVGMAYRLTVYARWFLKSGLYRSREFFRKSPISYASFMLT